MAETVIVFGRYIDLPAIGRKSWRVQKRLFAAKIRTVFISRRFSGAENLLYLLSKHDLYFYGVSLIPRELTPRVLRQAQREQHRANLPSPTLDAIGIHARAEANGLAHEIMDVEHLLLALLHHDPRSAALLTQYGVNYDKARDIVAANGVAGYTITLLGLPHFTFYRNRLK